ncbi:MAG: thiamine permease [Spirochaetaceae bacterium]|nr:MAG: thiamine permease [Spirochaetaceae bacterium]
MSDVNVSDVDAPTKKITMREIVITAAIGVVFGFLYLGWVQVWLIFQGIIGPLAMDIVFGFWFVASVVAMYALQKPGVALVTAVITTITQVLAGNPAGAILLVTGLVQGAGAELPFLLTRWRRFSLPVLMLSGASAAVFSYLYTWIRFGYGELGAGILIAMLVLRVTSGMLLGGLLGKFLTERLHATGALRGLAIDRARKRAA